MGLATNNFVKAAAFAAIGFLLTRVTQAQDQKGFDFKCPAGPARAVFADLSKAAGESLVASTSVANDVIVLDLHGVTVADAMAKIAQTLHGDWRKEGSGWVLYRGSNVIGADQRAETAVKVAQIRSQIAQIAADQKADGAFDAKKAQKLVDARNNMFNQADRGNGTFSIKGDFMKAAQQTPASRAIVTLLSRMSDAQLASIASGKRVVFSTAPNRMQLAMPNGAQQIIRNFIQEQTLLHNASKQADNANANDSRRIVINGFGDDNLGDGDPSLGIGYAMLVASPGPGGPNANLSLVVSDTNGKTLASGNYFVGGGIQNRPADSKPAAEEKPIELSDLAKELVKLMAPSGAAAFAGGNFTTTRAVRVVAFSGSAISFSTGDGGEKTPVLSDALRERILNPEKYEPLSLAPSEALLNSAEQKGKNLVAYLPDISFTPLSQALSRANVTPTAFLADAQNRADLQVVEDGGWLMVSPKSPIADRERITNRYALGPALRSLDKKGYLTLDELAQFAFNQVKEPRNGDIDELYFRLINTQYAQSTFDQYGFNGNWPMLQFWATMSTAQRQTVLQGGRLPIANFSQQQLNIVAEQVYQSFDGPQVQTPNENQAQGPRRMIFGGTPTALTERTVVLPNGVIRDGFLTVNVNAENGVQGKAADDKGSQFMNAGTLAFYRLSQERADLNILGATQNIDRFRASTTKRYSFEFTFAPNVTLNRSLEDNSPSDLPFGSYDQLPSDFRKQVDQQLEQLRNGFKGGVGFGPGGGKTPPPL